MKLKFFFIFIIFNGLIFSAEQSKIIQPEWVLSPEKACPKASLCAVGEGPSLLRAKLSARAGLARLFRSKIKSSFKVSEFSKNEGKIETDISEDIQENTDIELSSVETIKVFEGRLSFYALAKLNKLKAARALKEEISKKDEELLSLIKQMGTAVVYKLDKIFLARELLHFRYQFLTNQSIKPAVSYKKILELRNKISRQFLIDVNIHGGIKENRKLDNIVRQALVAHVFRVVPRGRSQKATTHKLEVVLVTDKLYFQVRGFIRYKFSYSFVSTNIKTGKTATFLVSTIQTGRNFNQAKEKSQLKLIEELDLNFEKINFL